MMITSKKKKEKKFKRIKITKSKYNHMIIYLGETCAHADMRGINFFNLSKYYL